MGTASARNALRGAGSQPQPVIPVNQSGKPSSPDVFKPFSVSVISLGIGPQTVWTPAATTLRFRLMGATISSDKAQIVNFKDGTVASIYATGKLLANTPYVIPAIGDGILSASANNLLRLDVDGGVPVVISGTVWGREE